MKEKNVNEYNKERLDKLLEVQHILKEYIESIIEDPDESTDVGLLGEEGFKFVNKEQELLKKLHTIINKLYT